MHTSNKKHREFEEQVRALGCCITDYPAVEIHHVVGRKSKHNKQLIGPWFILPLRYDLHRDGATSVHGNAKMFRELYGYQCELFVEVIDKWMQVHGDELPFDQQILEAILSVRK